MASDVRQNQEISTLTIIFGIIAFVYYLFIWFLGILGLIQARSLFGVAPDPRKSRLPELPLRHVASTTALNREQTIGVSILRPLAGLDHNLLANLVSSFEQQYPKHLFEIILSVRNEQDQALSIAQQVCDRYPNVQSRIIVGEEACGVNPKIANLVRSYAASKFDVLWVIDAQVQVSPYALGRAVEALTSKPRTPSPQFLHRLPNGGVNSRVGLVHHVPLGVTPHSTSMGSHIEAVFLSTNHAKMYLAINALSLESCVMGKSNMYRKSDLACIPDSFFKVSDQGTRGEEGAIGSKVFQRQPSTIEKDLVSHGPSRPLARFGIYLAEDNMLATALWKPPLNLAHTVIAKEVARTSVGEVRSFGDYWERRVRWIRVRRHMVPAATYIEPFTESIVCGLIGTIALVNCWLPMLGASRLLENGRLVGFAFFLLHELMWHSIDFSVLSSLQTAGHSDPLTFNTGVTSTYGNGPFPLIDFTRQSVVLKFRLAWLFREVLALPIWFAALSDNKVIWRGRRYRILSDSRAAHADNENENSTATVTRDGFQYQSLARQDDS